MQTSLKWMAGRYRVFSKLVSKNQDTPTHVEMYRSHSHDTPGGNSYGDVGFASLRARHQAKVDYLKRVGLGTDSKVLDIGCGFASLGYMLLTQILGPNGRYVGVDVSVQRIKHAARLMKLSGLDCQLKVIRDMKDCLEFNGITWITIFSVFTHIFNEDIANCLLVCNQTLDNGGQLCFSFLDIETPKGLQCLANMMGRESRSRFNKEFYTVHSLDYVSALLRFAGFKLLDSSLLPPNVQRFCVAEKVEEKRQLSR